MRGPKVHPGVFGSSVPAVSVASLSYHSRIFSLTHAQYLRDEGLFAPTATSSAPAHSTSGSELSTVSTPGTDLNAGSEAAGTRRHSIVAACFSAAKCRARALRRHPSQEVLAVTYQEGGNRRLQAVNDSHYTELDRQETVDELRAKNQDWRRAYACLSLFAMLFSILFLLCLNTWFGYLRTFLCDQMSSLLYRAMPRILRQHWHIGCAGLIRNGRRLTRKHLTAHPLCSANPSNTSPMPLL